MKLQLLGVRALAVATAASMAVAALAQGSDTSAGEPPSGAKAGGGTSEGMTGTPPKAGKKHEVSGQVKSIGKQALTLSNGEQVRLTDQTKFLRNGQPISRDQIKPGEQVRAAFEPRGGLAYAITIEVQEGGGMQPGGGGQ